ncbi:hypothetical protein AB6813_11395 [bacterium RCC_150]
MDGQQWIWVAAVLLGAALTATVVVFGRRNRSQHYRQSIPEGHERDTGDPAGRDEGVADERLPRHP